MSRFARMLKQSSAIIDTHLSDCLVTFGSSVGWADSLEQPLAPRAVFSADQRITLPGQFEDSYIEGEDAEVRTVSVNTETLRSVDFGQQHATVLRGDRLLIELEEPESPVPFAFEVISAQPDGKWRTHHVLKPLGPSCEHNTGGAVFPLTFPVLFGGQRYSQCAELDGAAVRQ